MARGKTGSYSPRQQLEHFLVIHNELYNSRLLRNGFAPSFSLNWNHLQGMSVGSTQPDEEDLRSYLTVYRKFISEESPIYIYKIFNLCQQYLLSVTLKAELTEARKYWGNQLKGGVIKLNYNEKDITPEYLCDLWLNGVYFHDDLEKRRKIESLHPFQLDYLLVRHIFLDHICQTSKYILFLGFVVKAGFRDGLFNSQIS